MPDWVILVPFIILLLGAIVFTAATRIPERARYWLPIVILILALGSIFASAASSSHRLELSRWDVAGFAIVLRLDGIALVLLGAIFISVIALHLAGSRESIDSFTFYVLLSSALLIGSANLFTIVFAWAFLDLALFAWRAARRLPHDAAMRALILGQLAGLVLFAGALLLDAKQTQLAATLIALAFWARLGLFPFHWIYPNEDLHTLEFTAIRGAALAAGASLWLHWNELKVDAPGGMIVWLSSLAFIAAIVRIASEREAMEKIAANVSSATIFVPLAAAFAGDAAIALSLWNALGVVFALAMFELALVWQSDPQSRWARLFFSAGVLSAAGLPLTPAFLGRLGTLVALIDRGIWFVLGFAVIAATFSLAPLWRISTRLRGAELREPRRREYGGLELLGLVFLVYAFSASALAQVTGDSVDQALDLVIRTDNFAGVGVALLALVAPAALSIFLARVETGYHPQFDEVARFAAGLMELDWLAHVAARIGEGVSALARSLAALAEENPTVWILFVALWIAIFILTTR